MRRESLMYTTRLQPEAVRLEDLKKHKEHVKMEKKQQKELEALMKRQGKERQAMQSEQQKTVDRLLADEEKGGKKSRWETLSFGKRNALFQHEYSTRHVVHNE